MHVWRSNTHAEIHGAPPWFLDYLGRHLSIAVAAGQRPSERFGRVWWWEGEPWGSLVHQEAGSGRVAAGLTPYVAQLAQHYRLPCEVHDRRQRPEDRIPWWSVDASWRPYQDAVHKAVMANPTGVVDAPPRSGKTLMAARILDALACPALYVAPTVAIVEQTYRVLSAHFGTDMVARLDGNAKPEEKDISRPIVISTAPSAVRQEREWFRTRELLIIDEFHHAAAETYHKISAAAENAYFRYMLTGTHFRSGDDALAMQAVCSQVIHQIHVKDLVPDYLAPPRVFFVPVRGPKIGYTTDWHAAYEQGIVDYEPRNEMIVRLATMLAVDNGVPTLVLCRRRAHADALGERIPESVVVKGGAQALTSKSVARFLEGRHQVLIGTTVLGEGVDVPRAAALIYASAGNEGVGMMQSYFRPLTAAPGKTVGRIYDFQDRHHDTLRAHARNRMAFAERQLGRCVLAPGRE
jgi:superfamily II DNA or RNA helicase